MSTSADHALKLMATAVGMTPREVMRNPSAARARWEALQADRRRQATAAALDPGGIYARYNRKTEGRT